MWYVQPAHMRSLIRAFASRLNILSVKLLTEHHLEFISLKGGCTGSSESTLVKMPHCWKSRVVAHFILQSNLDYSKCQGPHESFRIIGSLNDRNREFLEISEKLGCFHRTLRLQLQHMFFVK